jgi:hypothetical protein
VEKKVMNTVKLGKLEKGDLRKVWLHEARDFTNWLAIDGNLRLLSDEIGIDIKLLQTEALVGKFSADILAEEENTGRKVIIENQLEVTNHDHLGKLITYASGYDAGIIIWIVESTREEHVRAIDWLNEHTDENIGFFLIRMEIWKIGDSPYAPKFQVISQPNNWAKAVKEAAAHTELNENRIQKLDFWSKFKEYALNKKTRLRLRKPDPNHWYDISIGSSIAHITLTINSVQDIITCELYIPNSKELFASLFTEKDKIEAELGTSLDWMELPGKKASRIRLAHKGDLDDTSKWNEYFAWLLQEAEQFYEVFSQRT